MAALGDTDAKRVRFCGSVYIEYDAEQAPVVHLGGAQRHTLRGATGSSRDDALDNNSPAVDAALLASLRLECAARGLTVVDPNDATVVQDALAHEYARELRSALAARGFVDPSAAASPAAGDDVALLQRQVQLADVLLTQVALQAHTQTDARALLQSDANCHDASGDSGDVLTSAAETLRRLQLAKKDLEGHVDDGYVFGRRFCSVEAFINTLEFDDLVALAQTRALAVPDLTAAEKKAISVVERELCAKYTTTGLGKPLKQLTLRELTVEAHARELIVVHARGKDGKRSKKGLIEKLRPVLRQEVIDEKILDKRDDLLRALLLDVLEREAALAQTNALVHLIARYLERLEPSASSASPIEKQSPQLPTSSPSPNDENANALNSNAGASAMDVDADASTIPTASVHKHALSSDTARAAAESARVALQRSYRLLMERLEVAQAVRDAR